MAGKAILNLAGVSWPLCLMKCNQAVQQMQAGATLEVIMKDADVVDDMVRLVTRTGPCDVEVVRHSNHISLYLTKLERV